MKKIYLFLLSVVISASALANSDNYNFTQVKNKMENNGYQLEYVKKDVGFNFKKGNTHVEVTDYKTYPELNAAIAKSINLLEEKGYKLIPEECDFGHGVFVFTNPTVKDYVFVLSTNYKKNILLNSGGTPADLEFAFKTLKDNLKSEKK